MVRHGVQENKEDRTSTDWKRIELVQPGGGDPELALKPRSGFGYVLHNKFLYVHGGSFVKANEIPQYFNDLYRLNMETFEWSAVLCTRPTPLLHPSLFGTVFRTCSMCR